ncbi:sugar transferase [Lederbergia ruris]|uniref:sugar transferase n=1 Tax=Lederbergia ruris TaxID=217495 RepID=UPI0039A17325
MYKNFLKRILDILISIIGLPIFILLYIALGLLIKFEDKGPIFYKADRIGKDSKSFKMYKFRSMKVNAPTLLNEDGSTYNSEDDPRVTKIGKFLRETSLDEIPQILNVIKGEMSIIGPRASLLSALGTFQKDEIDKMKVKPGITGFTQAYYRNGLSNREKRLKDAWYANNVTLLLDIRIFLKTIATVIKREGLYTNKEVKPNLKQNKDVNL